MDNNIVVTENVSELRKLRRKRKRTSGVVLGIVVNIFAVLGILLILMSVVRSVASLFDNSKDKKKLEEYLLPVVINDVTTFENLSAVSDQQLKMIALWGVFVNNDLTKFTVDEQDYVIIPASEFEVEIKKLFGPDVTLNHGTFNQEGDYLSTYIYDSEINSYRVSPKGRHDVYSPSVISITKVDDQMSVLVGFIPPEGFLEKNVRPSNYEPDAEQYREYIIKVTGSDMQIIKVIDRPDLHPSEQEMASNAAQSSVASGQTSSDAAPEVG